MLIKSLTTLSLHSISEHVDLEEAKSLFETNYSHVYYILYDTFVQAEQNLKQRGVFLSVNYCSYDHDER